MTKLPRGASARKKRRIKEQRTLRQRRDLERKANKTRVAKIMGENNPSII